MELKNIKNKKTNYQLEQDLNVHKILCIHCKRTKTNGLRCLGICVAESDY